MKSTKFEIRSVALSLKAYIWLKEDLGKFTIQLLDQTWPLEPIRLLGIRMSSLRSIADIKKDKSLTDFFSVKLSKEQKGAEIQKQLEKAKKESDQIPKSKATKEEKKQPVSKRSA